MRTDRSPDNAIRAEVRLSDPKLYVRLLHGFFATHDTYSHDHDQITFTRDDGMSLYVDTCVNYVSFGPAGADDRERLWSENISVGDIKLLLVWFIGRDDGRMNDYDWLSRHD